MSRLTRVLIAEDGALVAMDLEMTLSELGYFVVGTASSSEQVLALTTTLHPDLILMDVRLKGKADGFETATEIHKQNTIPVLFVSAGTESAAKQKIKLDWSTNGFLSKPFSNEQLNKSIGRLLEPGK